MTAITGSTAAITGAASGIGRSLAIELAARGCNLALADRAYVMALGRNDLEGTLLYALVLGITIALSAFTYRWVETPGREWTRRWLGRPSAAPARVRPQGS